jgi:hypothetical protein
MSAYLVDSQGTGFAGIQGLTNIKVTKTGPDPTDTSNRLDASTLDIQPGSDGKRRRVYVDGLPDPGQGADDSGITTTVTVQFFGTPPVVGDEVTEFGADLICTEVEIEYAVGELVKGSATYVTKPPEDEEE